MVDDEPSLRESAVELFRLLGFGMVFEAGDGLEALEVYKARKNQIVLVFMDLTMPQMNGGEAFRAMRAMDPQVKVILTSGFDEESCLEAGNIPRPSSRNPIASASSGMWWPKCFTTRAKTRALSA